MREAHAPMNAVTVSPDLHLAAPGIQRRPLRGERLATYMLVADGGERIRRGRTSRTARDHAEVRGMTARVVRRVRVAPGIVVAAGILAACQPERPRQSGLGAAVDTSAIAASLESLGAVVMRAHNTGDAELFASTWAEDGILSAPGSPPIRGRDSIVSAFRRSPRSRPVARSGSTRWRCEFSAQSGPMSSGSTR